MRSLYFETSEDNIFSKKNIYKKKLSITVTDFQQSFLTDFQQSFQVDLVSFPKPEYQFSGFYKFLSKYFPAQQI